MMKTVLIAPTIAMLSFLTAGCGHYPAPIRSDRDIERNSPSESMIVIVSLPIEHWPKLQKFELLEDLRVAEEMAPEITDRHLHVFSRLDLPKLRQVSFAYCRQVTDEGLRRLTNFPTIEGFQLIDAGITDTGMSTLAAGFPNLRGINVERCRFVTERGFLSLTNSATIADVSLSLEPLSQSQVEHIIQTVTNVTWWTISDPSNRLDHTTLREIGASRNLTIQVADESNVVRGITNAQQ